MKILIDTNVILDFLTDRVPFFESSAKLIGLCESGELQGYITANTITDIIYILRKHTDIRTLKSMLLNLFEFVDIIDVNKADILKAFEFEFSEYEDALQCQSAIKERIDFIVTRNEKDFKNSKIPVKNPKEF